MEARPCDYGGLGDAFRSDGQSADAGPALAHALPLEPAPRHVTGDKKYGTEDIVIAIEDQDIRIYIPLPL